MFTSDVLDSVKRQRHRERMQRNVQRIASVRSVSRKIGRTTGKVATAPLALLGIKGGLGGVIKKIQIPLAIAGAVVVGFGAMYVARTIVPG